jgi:hypothetical protein
MKCIVGPNRRPSEVAKMRSVEVVTIDESVIHDNRAIPPEGMPTPASPTNPRGAKETANIDTGTEAEE